MQNINKFFKIPFVNSKTTGQTKSLHIVGIIDSSGSMGGWWKQLAEFWNEAIPKENLHLITFDNSVHVAETGTLDTDIGQHGGGGTNITIAFEAFEKHLETLPHDQNITAIFISDGQDNQMNTLEARLQALKGNQIRKVNFICLGIEQGFPTFISMRLRTLYHKGDENIPALYLIEYAGDKAFFNKFEGMKNYFNCAGAVKIDPPCCLYPWDESVIDEAYEGSWVIVKNEDQLVLNNDNSRKFQPQTVLNVEEVVEVFRGWVQSLQLNSLRNPKECQKFAQCAFEVMNQMLDALQNLLKINLRQNLAQLQQQQQKMEVEGEELKKQESEDPEQEIGQDFCQRAKVNYIMRYGQKISWFLSEVEQLAKEQSPKQESEFEAAKRMNIGTITGKYQQKVLALKNITSSEFQLIVQEFKAVVAKNLPNLKATQSQFKKLIMQPNFLEGFDSIRTQFDLIECFQMGGLACKIKRYAGCEYNPWDLQMRQVVQKYLDIVFLVKKQFAVHLSDKNAQSLVSDSNDQAQEVNCFIEFFEQEDADLSEILSTRLVKLVYSINVTNNFDQIYDFAYLSLIGSTMQLVYKYGANPEVQQKLIQDCIRSLNIFYGQQIVNLSNQLVNDFTLVAQQNLPLQQLFVLYAYAVESKLINNKQARELLVKLQMYYLKNIFGEADLKKLIKPEFTAEDNEKIGKLFTENFKNYFSISEFRKDFDVKYIEYLKQADRKVSLQRKVLDENANFLALDSFSLQVFNAPLESTEICHLLKHIQQYPQDFEFLNKQIVKDEQALKDLVLSNINANNLRFISGYSDLYNIVDKNYSKYFEENHFGVKPLTKQQLEQQCNQLGIEFEKLGFNENSGLCQKACLSEKCSFYLQYKPDFKRHMDGWKGRLPQSFHIKVKANASKNPQELYNELKQKYESKQKYGKKNVGKTFPESYNVTAEFVIDYIKKIQEQFKNQPQQQQQEQQQQQMDEEINKDV